MKSVICMVDWENPQKPSESIGRALGEMYPGPWLKAAVVISEPQICIGGIQEENDFDRIDETDRIFLSSGMLCRTNPLAGDRKQRDEMLRRCPDGLFNLLVWNRTDKTLTVVNDYLALRPLYIWREGPRLVLSNEIKAFKWLLRSREVNMPAMAGTLLHGHPAGNDTIIKGVRLLDSRRIQFGREGSRNLEPLEIHFPNQTAPAGSKHTVGRFMEALDASARSWFSGVSKAGVALSGGLDSRLALGAALHYMPRVETLSFGDDRLDEVQSARKVAAKVGVQHHLCRVDGEERISLNAIQEFVWSSEALGELNGPWWSPFWTRFLHRYPHPVITGYLNDALIGGHLLGWGVPAGRLDGDAESETHNVALAGPAGTTMNSSQASFYASYCSKEMHYWMEQGATELIEDVFKNLPGQKTYQRILAFDLLQRQRRYISWFPNCWNLSATVLNPFCSRAYIDFFTSLPSADLLHRRLAKQCLREFFPQLARLPEGGYGRMLAPAGGLESLWDKVRRNRITESLLPWTKKKGWALEYNRVVRNHADVIIKTLDAGEDVLSGFISTQAIARDIRSSSLAPDSIFVKRLFNIVLFLKCFFENNSSAVNFTD